MRILLAAAVIVSLTLPVTAKEAKHKPETATKPDYAILKQAADICSAKGAFGRKFGRSGSGRVDTVADDAWAPFTKLSITQSEIIADASFRGVGETEEEDEAAAKKFTKALDKAVTAKHVLGHRKAHSNGVEFHTDEDPASGISFLLHQDEAHITATCINADR